MLFHFSVPLTANLRWRAARAIPSYTKSEKSDEEWFALYKEWEEWWRVICSLLFINAKPKSVNFLRAILSHKEQIALVFEQVKRAIRSFCSCRSLSKERIPNPVASAQYLQYLFILYTTVYMNMFSGPALPINYFWPNISTAGLSASVPYIYIYILFVYIMLLFLELCQGNYSPSAQGNNNLSIFCTTVVLCLS